MPIKVEVDWNRDGDYSDASEDATLFVRPGQQPLSVSYGRDQSTALAPTVSGSGSFTLDNRDRRFSPRATTLANGTANPLYGLIKPARPVKISRTVVGVDSYSGSYADAYSDGTATYVLFVGHTDDNPINPEVQEKTVSLALVDSLADFRGQTISTGLYSGIRTGEAIGLILDACGWSASLRDLDSGATVIPWFWVDGKDALTALEELIRSEGPPALLTIGADGEIVFRDRHHRLIRPASITSQSTWRATGTLEPVMQRPGFTYDEAWSHIINTGSATVDVRAPQELQVIWTSDTTISLSAGEEKLVTASVTDPFYGAIPPVAGADYVAVSGTVTSTLFRNSGASATIKLTAGAGPAVISGLQLRAQPLTVAYTVELSASDPGSIDDYGSRSFPGDLPWCNPYDAQAVLSQAVAQRAQPLPIVSARFVVGNNITKAAPILARDLSDRVTVVEPETAINGDFYVETLAHELTGTHDHAVTIGVEAVPAGIDPVFRFGTDGTHGFGFGKFGNGIPDPANLFIFGSTVAGHRMGEGVFVP